MTEGGIDWQAVGFFVFNAAFTAFNARIAWMNWKREDGKSRPSMDVTANYTSGPVVSLAFNYLPAPATKWKPVSATIRRPRSGKVANPMQHLKHREDRPWDPGPPDVDWSPLTNSARLFVKEWPGRESVLLLLPASRWPKRIWVDVLFESSEPQPRRYTLRVKRAIPAFKEVITT